jgi:hypothetical protein
LYDRGKGFHGAVIVAVVVIVVLVEIIRPADDFETRDGRIRALGERRREKGEVEKQIAKQERRIKRRDPQDVRQVYLRTT